MMDFDLAHFLYEEDSLGIFLFVSVAMGAGAAWLSGRAVAATWRPVWQVVIYMLILALAVRFIHFALFGGTLLSLHYYLIDASICLIAGFLAFRATRAQQMAGQYRWLYRRTGFFTWSAQ